MPDVLPRVGAHGDDRRQEQVVTTAGAPELPIPRRAVADTDVKQVEVGVVGHRVPDGSAAAERPPLTRPGLCCFLELRLLERFRRIARHGIETPGLLAGR